MAGEGKEQEDGTGVGPASMIPALLSAEGRRRLARQLQQDRHRRKRRLWFGLGLGQVLSLLIALTGVFSSLLARDGASRPTTQSALTYVLLSLYLIKRPRRAPLQVPWWRYALLVRACVRACVGMVYLYG